MFKKAWTAIAVIGVVIATIVSKAPMLVAAASIIGVVFVLAVAFKKTYAPLLGALLSVIYAVLSYEAGFFANAIMNMFILVPLQIWGYHHWKLNEGKIFEVAKKYLSGIWVLTVIGAAISATLAYISGSHLWFLDGVSSVLVITGTVLLTLKTKEQWYAWIPYNAIECIMWFMAMSLEPSVLAIFVMRVIFLINSLIGAKEWCK